MVLHQLLLHLVSHMQFIGASLVAQMVKNLPTVRETWVRDPWRRELQPTPVFLPRQFHGQRSLVSFSPWGRQESDTTQWLTHTEHPVALSAFFFDPHQSSARPAPLADLC